MSQTVRQMLDAKEAELEARLAEIRAEMAPVEQELDDVRKAKAALGVPISQLPARGRVASAGSMVYYHTARNPNSLRYLNWTMKQLIRKALSEQFRDGATARQLIDYFHEEFGRVDIIRSSLSPQLSRLRADGDIERDGLVWRLTDEYWRKQLFDDAPNENEPPSGQPAGGSDAEPTDGLQPEVVPSSNTQPS